MEFHMVIGSCNPKICQWCIVQHNSPLLVNFCVYIWDARGKRQKTTKEEEEEEESNWVLKQKVYQRSNFNLCMTSNDNDHGCVYHTYIKAIV